MITIVKNMLASFRQLRWKLTLSYTAVTVGALLVIVIVAGYLMFSAVLVPLDVLDGVLSPRAWIEVVSRNAPEKWQYLLSQDPIDTELLAAVLEDGDLQVTYFDLFRVGDLQVRLRTAAQGSVLMVDPDGILLATSSPSLVSSGAIGKPLDTGILPGLEGPLATALSGEVDPDQLFVTIEPNERFYFAIPYLDEATQDVLGVAVIYFQSLPAQDDVLSNTLALLSRSVVVLLLAAGLVGALFGALTARGMVNRLNRVSQVTDAWSQGDFSEFIEDPAGDEISQLAQRLNRMAEQLQTLLRRRQAMAISEERNRLARDLHDSAKQQALAASFQLGTALTLFDRDPEAARSHLKEAEGLVDSVRKELTDLILELRPPTMNGQDLPDLLNEHVIEWAHQNDIQVDITVKGYEKLSLELEQTLFRIAQEALANVARHSSAGAVAVALIYEDGSVTVSISDDGCGFDTERQYAGMGLDSMRERAAAVNGEFRIESAPDAGTKVSATLLTG